MNDDPESTLARSFRESLLSAEAEAPSFEDVAAYVDGRLQGDARVLFEERLREDPLLQAEVTDLEQLRAEMARPRRPAATVPAWTYLAAAAVLVAAIAGFLLTREPRGTGSATGPVAGAAPTVAAPAGEPAVVAALHDGAGSIELRADGTLRGPRVPEALTSSVVRALRDGAVTIPSLRADLAVAPVTAMGPSAGGRAVRARSDRCRRSSAPIGRPCAGARIRARGRTRSPCSTSSSSPSRPRVRSPRPSGRPGPPCGADRRISGRSRPRPRPAPRRCRRRPRPRRGSTSRAPRRSRWSSRRSRPGAASRPAIALAEAGFLEEAAQRFDTLAAENPESREVQRLRAALAAARKR